MGVIAIVAIALAIAGTFRIAGMPGSGGPEKISVVKFNLGPGTGGPDKIETAKWLLGPGTGGPEKVVPCYILMGYSVRIDL